MGCACSKASQASQPRQDAKDLPRLLDRQRQDTAKDPEGDVASTSWQQTSEGSDRERRGPQQQSDVLRPTVEDFQVTSSSWFCCPETCLTALPQGRPLKPRGAGAVDVSCHASEGSKWHVELLAMCADLKEKLRDPQFAATRCNLDGSGDLDPHELKQAARVYGISFRSSSGDNDGDDGDGSVDLGVLMDGQSRISKERFAEMVASQQATTSIRAVPHSLRGMALGQLQHLETLFVKTGWLLAQCESFNTDNAQAISNGTKFRQNPNLYALDTFVVTPMSKPGICKARENDTQQTIAEAHGMSSFSELVNPFGLLVHCFVSHFWGHDFSSTIMALDCWADANYHRMTSEKQSLVYWICLFALNQHNVAEEVGENPQQGPFNAALAQATGGAVMVLDEEIKPFPREAGAAMTWHGCAGIDPISGCTTPDDKYLPGRGVL